MFHKISPNETCPCHSGKKYKKCCRPVHVSMKAPDPVSLVRARYSAYALGLIDFLMFTTHRDGPQYISREDRWQAMLESYCLVNLFPALEIISAEGDRVVYRAEIMTFGQEKPQIYTEDCIFKQQDGIWKYYNGTIDES